MARNPESITTTGSMDSGFAPSARLGMTVDSVAISVIVDSPQLRRTGIPFISATMKARVTVTLKSGVLDPQGKAIEGALKSLGVSGVASVRQGKVFDIEIEGDDKARAEAALKD